MTNFKKFALTVFLGIVALILTFGFKQEFLAYLLVIIAGGIVSLSMFIGMIRTLKSGMYGVDILAITAIIATLAVGDYWASLMILIMLTGGESLEEYATRQASRELRSLLDNSPQIAHKVVNDTIVDLSVDDLNIGDLVLVKPDEMVPVDGDVSKGQSDFDESSLTGEARPVEKTIGDSLLSGSINGSNAIYFQVTARAEDSQYQQLVKLVKQSADNPAPFVRLADRYAIPFTLFAYIIGGLAWFITKDPVRFAQVLVVASPCPLILAAPVALVAGMSQSSKNSIIVKTGTTIEKLASAKTFAFDKTGTITQGKLFVDKVFTQDVSTEELLSYAISLEQASSHILARSLVAYIAEKSIEPLPIEDMKEVTGKGVEAYYQGHRITAGRLSMGDSSTKAPKTEQTSVYLTKDGQYIGHITFTDTVRPEAKQTLNQLRDMGVEHLVMLSGDRKEIALNVAKEVNITEVYADCLPQDKIDYIRNTKESGRPIVMVGDGVNDAPALVTADVGIAMGAHGATAASESADVVILKDDFNKVAQAMAISQHTMSVAKQSVLIGLFVCLILMLIASTGVIPTLLGAMLQEVVDTVSILSALRARSMPKK